MIRVTIAIVPVIALQLCALDARPNQVTSGTRLEAPNKHFAAKCEVGDQVYPAVGRIDILDNTTGMLAYAVEIDPPLYALRWTGDSKTVIAIQRVAGGSVALIVHRASGGWKVFQAEPQQGGKFAVIALSAKTDTVELSYKVQETGADGKENRFYVSTFGLDPATGAHSYETKREIDIETYRRLRFE